MSPSSALSTTSSAASSPTKQSTGILTPTRKVKALLADLSDSDSTEGNVQRPAQTIRPTRQSDNSEDDDSTILQRGRMAQRLVAPKTSKSIPAQGGRESDALSSDRSIQSATQKESAISNTTSSSDERGSHPRLVRRFLTKKKQKVRIEPSSPESAKQNSTTPSRSDQQVDSSEIQEKNGVFDTQTKVSGDGRAKFLALVDKHRVARVEREAEEKAKKTTQAEEKLKNLGSSSSGPEPRRSSPLGSNTEDSDASSEGETAKKFTREARPTRKAGKKAMEEMNRETQRISRNMQLTHQAQTKSKVTKASLLARFNFPINVPTAMGKGGEAPSAPVIGDTSGSSDPETSKLHSTPPTSPLREPQHEDLKNNQATDPSMRLTAGQILQGQVSLKHGLASADETNATECQIPRSLSLPRFQSRSLISPKNGNSDLAGTGHNPTPPVLPTQIMRAAIMTSPSSSESESELEIVTQKGLKRKYMVFEALPRRKAREAPAHLALRSLANLVNINDKKCVMNTAQMELSLRRAARMQAKAERQAKVEELRAKGIVVQTAEEREREQQEVEDLVERARQEAAEIQKREKELAKKDGTFVKDALDEDDSDEDDEEFEASEQDDDSGSEDEGNDEGVIDNAAQERSDEEISNDSDLEGQLGIDQRDLVQALPAAAPMASRGVRKARVISDDEDEPAVNHHSPQLPTAMKTPQSIVRSARKVIPGLQMSDDLPMGLSQAFAATMAESQTSDEEHDDPELTPRFLTPGIPTEVRPYRLDSVDLVAESLPASQAHPFGADLSASQSHVAPESPVPQTQVPASQAEFELTQDVGYKLSPFTGNRFVRTPRRDAPHSTTDTLIMPTGEESPIVQKRGKLRRGQIEAVNEVDDQLPTANAPSAFRVMQGAMKPKLSGPAFDKKKSDARRAFDEAAEESEDEYAGLGGNSDEDSHEEEDEEDRKMIDEDTTVGRSEAAKLAELYADRERHSDEVAVSKLLKDLTTGALRRKRGAGGDLDLSDDEDMAARRREAKRRDFAKMRRELLKDEAVGKIAEDKKKEAFLRSIEDREQGDDDDDFVEGSDVNESQEQPQSQAEATIGTEGGMKQSDSGILQPASSTKLNTFSSMPRPAEVNVKRKPTTLAEIRESVSFLIEEPDSQANVIDLGLSDSEDDAEAYVDLDRHFREAEADENTADDEVGDLGGFIIEDEDVALSHSGAHGFDEANTSSEFKKPEMPQKERAPYNERRTKNQQNVVDRLDLLRQASSTSSNTSKVAFLNSRNSFNTNTGIPNLLRRATTNSSLGSMSGRNNVSATGVVTAKTNKTERGSVNEEKEFVRRGSGGQRNAVNYRAKPTSSVENKMSTRAGINKKTQKAQKNKGGFLGGLFRGGSWE